MNFHTLYTTVILPITLQLEEDERMSATDSDMETLEADIQNIQAAIDSLNTAVQANMASSKTRVSSVPLVKELRAFPGPHPLITWKS